MVLVVLSSSYLPKAQAANRFDIVVTEILADPSPAVGLLNAAFIEIKDVCTTVLT